MKRLVFLLLMAAPLSAVQQPPVSAPAKVDYLKEVRPLLAQNCYSCHGPEVQRTGLRLDQRQNALRGSDYGPVIIPGNSAESKMIRRVNGDGGLQMPPTGALTDEEIRILRAWIDQGAEFVTAIAEDAPPKPVDPKLAAVITAVRWGDRKTVEKLLTANPSLVNAKDAAGSTPLHHAAGFGTLDTMKFLLEKGADVHAKNRRSSTPLFWAIHDEAKVRMLVSSGAAVNAKQIEGRTPIYQAASLANGLPVLRFLLEKGADPDVPILAGGTPLMAAAARGDDEAMTALIDKGADVNARNSAGETVLMLAATNGDPRAVQLLLARGADVNIRSKRNETALGNAATAGVDEPVRLLLAHGAEVNVRNIRGYSPLMLAASSDAIPAGIVKMLLAKGADASYSADYDETALVLAAKRGNTEVVRLLGGSDKDYANGHPSATTRKAAQQLPVSKAVETALALLEKQSYNFIRIGGCNSCHSQDLPSAAAGFARDAGLRAPREIPQLPAAMEPPPERVVDFGIVGVASLGWELFDHGMNHAPRTDSTDAIVRYIKAMQLPEGNWASNESRRPPMNSGDFQAPALAIYAMKQYGPPAEKAGTDAAIAKAVHWLEHTKPVTTQDRAFHLLGLAWGNGSTATIKDAARSLASLQRPDGGWNQLPEMVSDAYATGEVLFALNTAGRMPITDPVYQKGKHYLMRTQADDGSWHVTTRAIWLQPYFESGFPYGRDQFISTAATAWASMALVPAAERQAVSEKQVSRK
jgi:ankyrin repeat protein/mono/diheme cytochrome c family protein